MPVLQGIRVPRLGSGRPRQRPEKVRADKRYSSRANRHYLRGHDIKATIPAWYASISLLDTYEGERRDAHQRIHDLTVETDRSQISKDLTI